jgi:hypothetical protein
MTPSTHDVWAQLRPPLRSPVSRRAFVTYVRALARTVKGPPRDEAVDELRTSFVDGAKSPTRPDTPFLVAAALVLADLAIQGWQLRVRKGHVEVRPPVQLDEDRIGEKDRIRRQELVKRNAQLRQEPVQKFLRAMERTRMFGGKFVSIFSLLRDGRELSEGLRRLRERNDAARDLVTVVDPYLEFVTSDEATCSWTGLRLMDIWRYFRHTWTNQYTSVPGRTMMFLVRDRAAACHPVVGIGALSSPVMQIRERDAWIGWQPDTFLEGLRTKPTDELAEWLGSTLNSAIDEIYVDDLREDGIISTRDVTVPDEKAIERLLRDSAEQRRWHHRYVRARDHKSGRSQASDADRWVAQARTHLFRSKRSLALAAYLSASAVLREAFGDRPSAEKLAALASTGKGTDTIRKILRKAKADRVGIAVADITVCGAVQPYNAILGGKLVAMLATSPEVVMEYRRRYSEAESEIASSMAGRAIVRTPALVLLGTTSLYGVGSSQYNRIKIPAERLGGALGDAIGYAELGRSEAFGTSQYSEETVDALADIVQQSADGQRVNSIFGEGVSPKLRKVRQGLDLLGLPSDLLLRHHRHRILYAVSLIRNLREYLLGLEQTPAYLVPVDRGAEATARIAEWWRDRWLQKRIRSDDVLAEVARHTLVRPIRHGARVAVLPPTGQHSLFADPS